MAVTNLIRSTAFDTAVHFKQASWICNRFSERVLYSCRQGNEHEGVQGQMYSLGLCCDRVGRQP